MRPWAPDLRQSERGPMESDGSRRLDTTPGCPHSSFCCLLQKCGSPIYHGDMGDSQMALCAQQSSQNACDGYLPTVPNTHTTNASVLRNVSTVQERTSEDFSLAETCLREIRLRH